MANYYYLVNSFPTIRVGDKPEISFEELKIALWEGLSEKDFALVQDFLFYLDLKNIKAHWMGFEIDPRANLKEKEIEEALLVPGILPSYVYEFLYQYQTQEERLHYFSFLYAHFFRSFPLKGFSHKYFEQERQIRLQLAAMRAKQSKSDITRQLQFEDYTDPDVAYILAQKDREEYDPPIEWHKLKEIFVSRYIYPKALLQAYLEYRFQLVEELEEEEGIFSLERVLGFIAKLLLVERFQFFDEQKGKEELQRI